MLRRLPVLLAFVCACASAVGEHEDPTTPAAMVGMPSPIMTSTPSPIDGNPSRANANASSPITTTKTIGDSQSRAPSANPSHRGRRIDLDVKGADIHDVFRLLADVGHVSIVVGDDVQGSVTVRMRQVPWDEALDAIVNVRGLFAQRDGNVIIVSAKPR